MQIAFAVGQNRLMVKKLLRYQETQIALGFAWTVVPLALTALGFYLGTIWATNSETDLRLGDIQFGLRTGAIGLLVGLLVAVGVTVFYPPVIEREYKARERVHH